MIFQCLKGGRGAAACQTAEAAGAGHAIYNLEGGIAAWKDAGLPVVGSGKTAAIPLFRQVQIAVGIMIATLIALGFSGLTAAEVFGAEATDWLTVTLMAEYSVSR